MPATPPTKPDADGDLPSEEEFVEGATESVANAIETLHDRGIATTHWVDGRLLRIHPDGHREDLGELLPQ